MTAYHSFDGEVEASTTPTICRLLDLHRHQLSTIAPNEAAHARLGEHLRALTPHVSEGAGADPTGEWPPEKSYFALGIDLAKAQELGAIFQQDAVVWTDPDRVPRLLLLR